MEKDKKGNKRLLLIIVLLLLVVCSYSTYSIYKSSATGTANAKAAAWVVKVNDTDIVSSDTYTFDTDDIVWDNSVSNAKTGTIAPGSKGTITIEINATGSEVPIEYTAAIGNVTSGTSSVSNSNFSVEAKSGSSLTGTIAQNDTSMKATVVLEVTWDPVDAESANADDIAMNSKTLNIPVTVTTKQHLS